MKERLSKNSAKCLRCNDILESVHRHDFKFCSCSCLAVDGGLAYARRLYHHKDEYEDMCEYTTDLDRG